MRPLPSTGDQDGARPGGDLLDIGDVLGKRVVSTRLHRGVSIRRENAAAALEVMSRFAVDPRWLVYLPPTMAPSDTAAEGEFLEHPAETFAHYRSQGIPRLICQEKHMGSRAVILLCRDEAAAQREIRGRRRAEAGVVYTRTGRPFFSDPGPRRGSGSRGCAPRSSGQGFWQRFDSDWILPRRRDHALVGESPGAASHPVRPGGGRRQRLPSRPPSPPWNRPPKGEAAARSWPPACGSGRAASPATSTPNRRYCWPVAGISDLRIAPFHLLATEGRVHTGEDHLWHMETLAELCRADDELLHETRYLPVDAADPDSEEQGTRWWRELTESGGEGMVVKPLDWLARGRRGPAQPALKCRGREYLRIIYGPEYTLPGQIERLRQRRLSTKRSLALREFALGMEAPAPLRRGGAACTGCTSASSGSSPWRASRFDPEAVTRCIPEPVRPA